MRGAVRLVGLSLCVSIAPPAPVAASDAATGASTLLVQLTSPAKFIGFPAVCPGTSPDEDQDEIICMAELYEAKAHVLRHLGGLETARRLTIRFTAHSFHAVWRKDVRFLLVVGPFKDKGQTGHFASYWRWENEAGQFCVDEAEARDQNSVPLRRLFASRASRIVRGDNNDWSKGSAIVCVSGNEKLDD